MKNDSGKTAYVNVGLIGINMLVFFYLELIGSTENAAFMYEKGAMFTPAILVDREYYRLITAVFMHFGIRHLINNMIVLFAVGDNMERALGHIKYLIFYILCGAGGNLISMAADINDTVTVSAGASGAIFGVVGGLLYVVTVNRGRLEDLSSRQLIIMIVLSLYLGFMESGVDNMAHIAGLILGLILAIVLYRRPKGKRRGGESIYER